MTRIPLAALLVLAATMVARAPEEAPKKTPEKKAPEKLPLLLQRPAVNKTHIVFGYADDLWTVPRAGGEAKRLTTGAGVETSPVFSPDGKMIAFTGQYDGNEDVYIVPVSGGVPKRLTYHPGADQAVGWTPDGKRVLFRSARNSYSRFTRLFTVSIAGGLPEQLPLPIADSGSYSSDGKQLAYVPFVNHPRSPGAWVGWKRYKGGKQPRVWIANLEDSSVIKVPSKDSNDFNPMWNGGKVYFLSDRKGAVTLFAYDLAAKDVKPVIDNNGDDIKSASLGGDAIVYDKLGSLYLHDIKNNKSTRVPVTIKADLPGLRPRFVKVANMIQTARLSPTGVRAVFEARGEIFTVPAKKGDVRNLTRTSGVAERDPAWSPDGQSIAYFSDASGEYELHVRPQKGTGKVQKFALGQSPSFYYSPVWSPDGKKISYGDKRGNVWYLDLSSGKSTKVDTSPYGGSRAGAVWSPDSKWLAYVRPLKGSGFGAVFLYSLADSKATQVTDGTGDCAAVQFDKGGKYLYFTASTDAGPSRGSLMSSLGRRTTRSVYLVVLDEKTKSPLALESDEEEEKKPTPAPKQGKKPAPVVVTIDLEDIDQRILALPMPARNYTTLLAGKPGTIFLLEAGSGGGRGGSGAGAVLHRFDLTQRSATKMLEGISRVSISANGERLLYRQGSRWVIGSASGGSAPAMAFAAPAGGTGGRGGRRGGPAPASTGGTGSLNVDAMEVRVDPVAEWKQLYKEVWRIERDFLYDPGFHGLDMKKAIRKYEPYLAGIASRNDLSYLFEDMLGELSLGHVYIRGGDSPRVDGPRGGLLGCDFEIKNGRYRITKIYRGENYNPSLRSPLTMPGARVKVGEYLLAIDDEELKGTDNVYRLLEGKAGKRVTLKVSADPEGKKSREVEVVPTTSETSLRHLAWVADNRARVTKMTDGKIAYIYLPNTHTAGHERFVREFYPQAGKQGAIVDERFNGGGFLADEVVDALSWKPRNFIAGREGADLVVPNGIFGPKVMLINEAAGSGGDYLPYAFRQAKLGKLVGKRTWGGLVGIGGYPTLIDGGSVTAPHFALWFPNGKWDVENAGVAPDVEVEFDPKVWRAGRDPQLEKAVGIVLDELKKNPTKWPKRPAYPDYHKKKESAKR